MADQLELRLHVPFQGSAVDTGPFGISMVLVGARFDSGRVGQAVRFSGDGRAEVLSKVVALNRTFTMRLWARAERVDEFPTSTWLLMRFSGDNWLYVDFETALTSWTYISLIQDDSGINVYTDNVLVRHEAYPVEWGKPSGFAVVNDNPSTGGGFSSFEDLTIYRGVLEETITIPTLPEMDLNYYINGINFRTYGVYVSESNGVLDNLILKSPLTADWDDYHGEIVDLSRPRYQSRDMVLSCFIEGVGKDEFIDRVQAFLGQFRKAGTQRLMITVHTGKPFVYEVYVPTSINLKKQWSKAQMIGTFELTLREPQPVKRVLRWSGAGVASITLTTSKLVQIYWGDGTSAKDIFGTGRTLTHTYTAEGEYYIIIAGVIEDITGFSSTASTIWNSL